jgi:hypothetical protein
LDPIGHGLLAKAGDLLACGPDPDPEVPVESGFVSDHGIWIVQPNMPNMCAIPTCGNIPPLSRVGRFDILTKPG